MAEENKVIDELEAAKEAAKYVEEVGKSGKWPIATPPIAKQAYSSRTPTPPPPLGWFDDPSSPLYGFPRRIEGESIWDGKELVNQEDKWLYHLTEEDITELKDAVSHFINEGLDLIKLTEENAKDLFPLKKFGDFLQSKRFTQLINGAGVWLLRGFPIEQYDPLQRSVLFLGVGAYLGIPVSQNAKGHLLGHVKDIGHDPSNPNTRIYATNERQWYHSDACDIVGLLCIQVSEEGGESGVASTHTIYNYLSDHRPDLLAVLASNFYRDRKNEIPPGKLPYYLTPFYYFHDHHLISHFDRNFLIRASRLEGVPFISIEQWEALDTLENLCVYFALHMILQPGDMQFVFNHSILHSREKYLDSPAHQRHLLRLWITAPDCFPLPSRLRDELHTGVLVPGMSLRVPLEAE